MSGIQITALIIFLASFLIVPIGRLLFRNGTTAIDELDSSNPTNEQAETNSIHTSLDHIYGPPTIEKNKQDLWEYKKAEVASWFGEAGREVYGSAFENQYEPKTELEYESLLGKLKNEIKVKHSEIEALENKLKYYESPEVRKHLAKRFTS